jgi:Mg-chelatase subunit ChlD
MAMRIFIFWALLLGSIGYLAWYRQKISLRWTPALLLRLVLIGFVLLGYYSFFVFESEIRDAHQEILVLDISDSIEAEALDDARDYAEEWLENDPNRIVIAVGEDVSYLLSDEWIDMPSSATNISGALQYGMELLGESGGRMLIASDGAVDDLPEVDKLLNELASQNIAIDFIQLPSVTYENDLYLDELIGPKGVWENSEFILGLPVYAPASGQVEVLLTINGAMQEPIPMQVKSGAKVLPIILDSGNAGILTVGVKVKWPGDVFEANNFIYAAYEVYSSPKVLLVSRTTDEALTLRDALQKEGADVEIVAPNELTTSLSELADYHAVVLNNVLAREINFEQMQGLKTFVVEFGRSLLVFGGRNSYNLGGYENSLLEPLLPIDLTPPERIERVPATYVMVLDRSGSMQVDESTDVSPIELTKEAAIRAIESLRPDDYLGVLTFSGRTNWDVDITKIGDGMSLRLAQDSVSQIIAAGGTLIYQALEEAVARTIELSPTEYKHILLMSDGASDDEEDTKEKFSTLAAIARRQNMTISTIALGTDSDITMLSFIAQEGNGRFYEVLDPTDLPGVMVSESKAAHSENVQLGETNLVVGIANHPVLSGFHAAEFPRVEGYNAVTSKANLGAEDILLSGNFGDPLLSSWQVGLGHVVAWMGDIGSEWVPGMDSWVREGEFLLQVIQYTLPDPTFDLSEVDLSFQNQEMIVNLRAFDYDGSPVNFLSPEFVYVDVDNLPVKNPMGQIGIGDYQAIVGLPPAGAYRAVIQYQLDGETSEAIVPFAINYPEEWQFDYLGVGDDNLEKWTRTLNSNYTSFDEELSSDMDSGWLANVNPVTVLIVIILLAWPAEIAIRRWQMPWRRP